MNPAWLLVYVVVFEIGTTDKHVRFDHRFEDQKSCQEYAMSKKMKSICKRLTRVSIQG